MGKGRIKRVTLLLKYLPCDIKILRAGIINV
jgi:hypothetical protein